MQMKKPKLYITLWIKHFGNLRTFQKYRKHSLAARALYIFRGLGFFICQVYA